MTFRNRFERLPASRNFWPNAIKTSWMTKRGSSSISRWSALCDFPASAYQDTVSRDRHRPGHLQENRRAPRRTPLGGVLTGRGFHFLLHDRGGPDPFAKGA